MEAVEVARLPQEYRLKPARLLLVLGKSKVPTELHLQLENMAEMTKGNIENAQTDNHFSNQKITTNLKKEKSGKISTKTKP